MHGVDSGYNFPIVCEQLLLVANLRTLNLMNYNFVVCCWNFSWINEWQIEIENGKSNIGNFHRKCDKIVLFLKQMLDFFFST